MGTSRARDNHDHPEQHISEEPNPTIVDEWSAICSPCIEYGREVEQFLQGLQKAGLKYGSGDSAATEIA